jgi:hypothetical protein
MTIHGVQQGSWFAGVGSIANLVPGVADAVRSLSGLDPNRPAVLGLTPKEAYVSWVNSRSGALPDIPYYNAFGDERLVVEHCFLPFHHGCVDTELSQWGDMILLPGSDNPTDTAWGGGARFLPYGYTDHAWQFAETKKIMFDPFNDASAAVAVASLINAPQSHLNITSQQADVQVNDCQTGDPISVDQELLRILTERLQGTLYACDPAKRP